MWRDCFEDFRDKIGGFDIFCPQSHFNNLVGIFLIIFCWEHVFFVCQTVVRVLISMGVYHWSCGESGTLWRIKKGTLFGPDDPLHVRVQTSVVQVSEFKC
jgi:hypothetical protein